MLSELRTNPSSVLEGLEKSDLTKLRNIYFDFDKADLDPDDEKYLRQVKKILDLDRTIQNSLSPVMPMIGVPMITTLNYPTGASSR